MSQRTPISYNVHPLVHYANVVIKCSKYPNNISEKYIMSPNYPNDYPNNYDEVLTFTLKLNLLNLNSFLFHLDLGIPVNQ